MDLVREILIKVESSSNEYLRFEGEKAEHVVIMGDAGLLICHPTKDGPFIKSVGVERLTWAGHDFLSSMRDDTIWNKAKEHVLTPGASWTFDILKEWAKQELRTKLGLPVQ